MTNPVPPSQKEIFEQASEYLRLGLCELDRAQRSLNVKVWSITEVREIGVYYEKIEHIKDSIRDVKKYMDNKVRNLEQMEQDELKKSVV